MASSMANLREWIDQSPHLRNIRRDDQVLVLAHHSPKGVVVTIYHFLLSPHLCLPCCLVDMTTLQILKQFLRGCKFSLERSKEKLDNFHLVKGALPEWFDR